LIDLLIYLVSVAGSFSIGYSIIRLGWPETQGFSVTEKISYAFLAGLPISIISIIVAFGFGAKYFFFMFGALYALFIAVAFAKRISFEETDSTQLVKKKKRELIPEKILAGDKKSYFNAESANQKEQVFKEKKTSIISDLKQRLLGSEQNKDAEKKNALQQLKAIAKSNEKKDSGKNKRSCKELGEDINLSELEKIERFE
jgi:hypothetical protein